MDYKLINKCCYLGAIGSIVAGTLIGLAAVWLDDFWSTEVPAKGLITTTILFTASVLGAAVTKMLTVEE